MSEAFIFLMHALINVFLVVGIGIESGKDVKKLWFAPMIPAATFLLSVCILFTIKDIEFIRYTGAYLMFGYIAMNVTDKLTKSQDKA